METWVFAALAAASFQTARFTLQKHMSRITLTATGATFARFIYSAPLAAVLAVGLTRETGWPALPLSFWLYGAIGGAAQIMATVATVMLFGRRNFVVGMTFIKTEVLLSVLTGFLVLNETISPLGAFAIVIGVAGVLVLSTPASVPRQGTAQTAPSAGGWRKWLGASAGLGLLAGGLFSISAVCYRGAVLQVGIDAPFLAALITLAAVTGMQLLGMALWLAVRDVRQIGAVLTAWRGALWIGLTSLAGSLCWFWGFGLQQVAYVKAVGQVEVVLGLLVSLLIFRERISAQEYLGMLLIMASVLVLIVGV
ncbi:MAG: EamA family transporter [Rhodobacteraceae bacterium]|nr:EamA family transporter [Paracoccaceae bacterium]